MTVVWVMLAGGLGSGARYLVGQWASYAIGAAFPYGTLIVNLVGSFLLGFIIAVVMKKTGGNAMGWKLFLKTSFCGGFTTFSTFALENAGLAGNNLSFTAPRK